VFVLLPNFLGGDDKGEQSVDLHNVSDGHDDSPGGVVGAVVEVVIMREGEEDRKNHKSKNADVNDVPFAKPEVPALREQLDQPASRKRYKSRKMKPASRISIHEASLTISWCIARRKETVRESWVMVRQK
jgi:hypothetical protein